MQIMKEWKEKKRKEKECVWIKLDSWKNFIFESEKKLRFFFIRIIIRKHANFFFACFNWWICWFYKNWFWCLSKWWIVVKNCFIIEFNFQKIFKFNFWIELQNLKVGIHDLKTPRFEDLNWRFEEFGIHDLRIWRLQDLRTWTEDLKNFGSTTWGFEEFGIHDLKTPRFEDLNWRFED